MSIPIWNSYGDFRSRGNPPKIWMIFAAVPIMLAAMWLADSTLNRIPRGEPERICADNYNSLGTQTVSTCSYKQEFGWPFAASVSTENKPDLLAADSLNSRNTSSRYEPNGLLIIAMAVAPLVVFKRWYLQRQYDYTKTKVIR